MAPENSSATAGPPPSRRPLTAGSFTALAVWFELFLIPASWLLAWIWPGDDVPAASWDPGAAWRAVILTLPVLALLALVTWTSLRALPPIRRIRVLFRRRFRTIFRDMRFWQIAAISAAAGVGEELLFRGVLQARIGLVATSIVFGGAHFITPAYFVFASLMGAYLGWLYNLSNNLLVPIIVHALYDTVALLVVRHEFRRPHRGGGPRRRRRL